MADSPHIWVLIPAHRPVLGLLQEGLRVLAGLADHTVVVTNGEHPVTEYETYTHVLHDKTPDVNISRWWNMGLRWIEEMEDGDDHHVLIMNADARIGPEGVAALSHALDKNPEAVMAGPMRGKGVYKNTTPGPLGLEVRLPGYCFMLRSSARLRFDERFRWWCGDDDLEWRAREAGGTLLVGPIEYRHLGDGTPRGQLLELAKEDLIRFEEKWRTRPW